MHRVKIRSDDWVRERDSWSEDWEQLFKNYPVNCIEVNKRRIISSRRFFESDVGKAYRERLRKKVTVDNPMHRPGVREKFDEAIVNERRVNKIRKSVLEQYRTGKKKPPEGFVFKNTKTGYFISEKNSSNIFYRSSLELKAYEYLENNSDVIGYDGKPPRIVLSSGHTYFPDVLVEYVSGEKILVEIKPFNWLLMVGAHRNRVANGSLLFIEKIEAAEQFCEQKGWKFQVWTDRDF